MAPIAWAKIYAKLDELDRRISAIVGRAQQQRKSRATIKRELDELCGDDEGGIIPPPPAMAIDRTPQPWWNTTHDPVLEKMLERSCSRRTGYDGDDAVEYGGR